MSTTAPRPLRADARRNREKVLAAAAAAFAEIGLDAQVEDIARRAGVGVGTVYRHFPTKEALVTALAEQHFERIAETVEAALEEPGDAWETFSATIWRIARAAAGDSAWCEIIAGHPSAVHAASRGRHRLSTATATLIERAHGAEMDWKRYLAIALDGLRAH